MSCYRVTFLYHLAGTVMNGYLLLVLASLSDAGSYMPFANNQEIKMTRNSKIASILILSFFQAHFVFAQSSFEILTKDEFAFREGKQVYRLGVKASDFEKQFGPPENRSKDNDPDGGYTASCTYLQYVNDGLEVLVDPKGIVKGFTFYVVPSTKYKAAKVRTDTGIESGASARQIHKLHGEPYKRDEFKVTGFDWLKLYYQKDSIVLTFKFDEGNFEGIGIYAGYLPYLEE